MGEKLTFFGKLCATLGPKLVLPRSAKEAAKMLMFLLHSVGRLS